MVLQSFRFRAIPSSMVNKAHADLLKKLRFVKEGTIEVVLKNVEFDGFSVIYALTDPGHERVVYIGETVDGGDLRGRLKAHLRDRAKAGLVEPTSYVYVHACVTEELAIYAFQEKAGGPPELNKKRGRRVA